MGSHLILHITIRLLMLIHLVHTEGGPILCSVQQQSWQEAMRTCQDAKGKPVLEYDILPLVNITTWTGDCISQESYTDTTLTGDDRILKCASTCLLCNPTPSAYIDCNTSLGYACCSASADVNCYHTGGWLEAMECRHTHQNVNHTVDSAINITWVKHITYRHTLGFDIETVYNLTNILECGYLTESSDTSFTSQCCHPRYYFCKFELDVDANDAIQAGIFRNCTVAYTPATTLLPGTVDQTTETVAVVDTSPAGPPSPITTTGDNIHANQTDLTIIGIGNDTDVDLTSNKTDQVTERQDNPDEAVDVMGIMVKIGIPAAAGLVMLVIFVCMVYIKKKNGRREVQEDNPQSALYTILQLDNAVGLLNGSRRVTFRDLPDADEDATYANATILRKDADQENDVAADSADTETSSGLSSINGVANGGYIPPNDGYIHPMKDNSSDTVATGWVDFPHVGNMPRVEYDWSEGNGRSTANNDYDHTDNTELTRNGYDMISGTNSDYETPIPGSLYPVSSWHPDQESVFNIAGDDMHDNRTPDGYDLTSFMPSRQTRPERYNTVTSMTNMPQVQGSTDSFYI